MDFKNVDKKYRPIPFWSWNEKLDTEETKRQIGIMDDAGIGGYFMHARGGLMTEYMGEEWFDNIKASIEEGDKRGMHSWAYDENGWPSGFGDLRVSGLGVEYQQKALCVEPADQQSTPDEYTVLVRDGYRYYFKPNPYYVDVLDKKVIRRFIDEIYVEYKNRCGDKFDGFFTDEPQILRGDGYPWSFPMIDTFKEKYGYDLLDKINELFFDEGSYMQTRVDFWKLATELFRDNFFKQIYDWCTENGYGFTGHLVCDDNLTGGLNGSGAQMPHYEYFTIPGMDWLGRAIKRRCYTALSLGSAAAQFGKKQVLSETFACCGHNVSHEELKAIFEGHLVRGVNLLCTHLEGYSNRGIRKRDYPPAMYYQQPWWDDVKTFFDGMSRIGMLIAEGKPVADTLVFLAQSSIWACYNGYNGAECRSRKVCPEFKRFDNALFDTMDALDEKHILYHLGDEIVMETHGRVAGGKLIIGNMAYSRVVIPDHLVMLPSTKRLLEEFEREGGVITTVDKIVPNSITEPSALLYLKREHEDFDLHYFVNPTEKTISATFSRANLVLDIITGETKPFFGSHTFAPHESLVLIDSHDARERMPVKAKKELLEIDGQWRVKSATYNSITLDRCSYSFDGELISDNGYVLDILPRLNELRRPVKLDHAFRFTVKELPETLMIATETPDLFEIKLNGEPIDKRDLGAFRDTSFRLLDVRPWAKVGVNEISFSAIISQTPETYEHLSNSWSFESMKNSLSYDVEVEQIYVVGDFGAEITSDIEELPKLAYRITEPPVVAAKPATVDIEHLDFSGYPEFAGTITLEKEINVDNTDLEVELVGRGMNSIHISVNGKDFGSRMFPPYRVDLSEALKTGKNVIELKILNNLRNMQGPFHHVNGELTDVCPSHFYRESNVFNHPYGAGEDNHNVLSQFDDRICLVHFGLNKK